MPPRYIKINANGFAVPNIGSKRNLRGLKSNCAWRMHGDAGWEALVARRGKAPDTRCSRWGFGDDRSDHEGRLVLVLQEEAEGGLRGDGLLLDGEVVLTEVGILVEELAELQPHAE